jgi:hypothetical protein
LSKVLKFLLIYRFVGALGQKQMWGNCVSACGWGCTLFNFTEALAVFSFSLSVYGLHCRLLGLLVTV